MKFTPTLNRLLVKKDAIETKTKSGIELDAKSVNPSHFTGEVITCGPEVKEIKPKQKIAFAKYGYDEVDVNDEKLLVVEEPAVLGTYE